MSILSSLAAPEVFVLETLGATSDENFEIMTILVFQ